MHVASHDLEADFPEKRAAIETLRTSDATFATLVDRYNDINREVVLLEQKDVPTDDFTFENLKKERVKLKDEIYSMLEKQSR